MLRKAMAALVALAAGCADLEVADVETRTYRLTENYGQGYVAESAYSGANVYATLKKDNRLLATLDYQASSNTVTLDPVDIPDDGLVTQVVAPPGVDMTPESANQTVIMYRMSLG